MKIGVDVRVLMDKQYSGVSVFASQLLKTLLKKDKLNAYRFFCNSYNKQDIGIDNKNTVQTFYPNKIFNYLLQKRLNYPRIDKVLGGVDLVYLPHINFASISKNVKKAITVHDLSFMRYPEFFSNRKNFWHQALAVGRQLRSFDKIIAVSNNTKNDLIELIGIDDRKIEVAYPGLTPDLIEASRSPIAPDSLRLKHQIDRPYILYLGTIEPRKNIAGLIRAYNLLREAGLDYLLVLAGGWGWKTRDIKREWQRSKFKDDIRFLSYIPESDKPSLYANAQVFVYPSFYEGFGFPPLEAMLFSVPVIASNVSSLPEVLGSSALLINPDKEEDLFEALKTVLSNNALANNLRRAGEARVANFSWNKTAQEYQRIFKETYHE